MMKLIEWLWGEPLGQVIRVKSWRLSLDFYSSRREDWGVAWPVLSVDRLGQRSTIVPIWNWMWLRNRLGMREKTDG